MKVFPSFRSLRLAVFALLSVLTTGSSVVFAVQPMSEIDLGSVSADAGENILNIYGASAAGLRDDVTGSDQNMSATNLVKKQHQESTEVESAVDDKIKTLASGIAGYDLAILSPSLDKETVQATLSASLVTVKDLSALSTNGEIRYKNENVHHDMKHIEDGGVSVERDLSIDLLKLENLRGDYQDRSPSAGSIYISDWRSQGETRIKLQ